MRKVGLVLGLVAVALVGVLFGSPAESDYAPTQVGVYGVDPSTGYFEAQITSGPATGVEMGGLLEPSSPDSDQAQILWVGDGDGNVTPTENLEGQITWSDGPYAQILWAD